MFYTNCLCYGNSILYRGVNGGENILKKVGYSPTLFLLSPDKNTDWQTLSCQPAKPIKFSDISDAKEFVSKHGDVENFEVFGSIGYQYAYLAEMFPDEVPYDIKQISIATIDIEVSGVAGFPDPEKAAAEVTLITYHESIDNKFYVFGCGKFTPKKEDCIYFKCQDEKELLEKFLNHWSKNPPNIISGWNVTMFDIPYLINRIDRVLSTNYSAKLSPWRRIGSKNTFQYGQKVSVPIIVGIETLDYYDLYRNVSLNPSGASQESYKLDHVAYIELGKKKVDYSDYRNLDELMQNDFQKYTEYNIKDVILVCELEQKLQLINMVIGVAYDAKVNYSDVLGQIRLWDAIIYNHLLKKKIVVPQNRFSEKLSSFAGAYVKNPVPGMYNWIMSFDLDSLYPHLIAEFNISPETLLPDRYRDVSVDNLVDEVYNTSDLDAALAGNGHCFSKKQQGFLPEILMEMYADRKKCKQQMIEADQELERIYVEMKKRGLT